MTRREQFNLEFHKSVMPDGTMDYDCEAMTDVNQDLVFATILRGFDEYDSEDIIESISEAQKGESDYRDFYCPDSLTDGFAIIISPPNVIISTDEYIQPLQVWKELMQEWLVFLKT